MIRIFTIFFLSVFQFVFSQTGFITSPQVISNAGGHLSQDNYNVSFTIGEIAIESYINQPIILTQGFHQENYQVTNLDEPPLHYDISVFPNPTQNQLNISFDIPKNTATIIVTDIFGGIVYSKPDILTDEDLIIELESFSQGVYWLEIILNKSERIIYQIQKIN